MLPFCKHCAHAVAELVGALWGLEGLEFELFTSQRRYADLYRRLGGS